MRKAQRTSRDGSCPYCGGAEGYAIQSHYDGYSLVRCKVCGTNFRILGLQRRERLPMVSVFGNKFYFNSEAMELFSLIIGERYSVEIGRGFVNFVQDENGALLTRKQRNSQTGIFSAMAASIAVREEFGLEKTDEIYLIYNQKKEDMGFIFKDDINMSGASPMPNKVFLSVRASGVTSISAGARDLLKIRAGTRIYLYEDKSKLYLVSGADMEEAPKEGGFVCALQGQQGFVDYYSINNRKLAGFLCERFKMDRGETFRLQLSSKPATIDGIRMYEVKGVVN